MRLSVDLEGRYTNYERLIFGIETHISAYDFTVFHMKDYKLAVDGCTYINFGVCYLFLAVSYKNNLRCTWKITVTSSVASPKCIQVVFPSFQLEDTSNTGCR